MSDSPLVSVILPFYKSPNLKNAIDSILSQTYQNFELILIDNNSDEASRLNAKEYQNDPKVSIREESRQGVVFAMNSGIETANGSYIMRMDADDYSYPDRIEKQLEAFQKDIELSVVSGEVVYQGPEKNKGFRIYVEWLNSIKKVDDIRLNQFVEFPLVNPSLMFRSNVFQKFGVFEEGDFPEDYEFFLRLLQHKVKIGKVKSAVLKWVDSESRLTRTDIRYSTDAFFRIKAKYLACWLKENNPCHPNVLIWGSGRVSKKRSSYLNQLGIIINGYIDIVKKKNTIHFNEIPEKESCFIISYVANRGAREEIRSFLVNKGYEEGYNFILAS